MHIINKYGVHHTIPDEWKLPAGSRRATPEEIAAYEEAQKPAVAPAVTDAPSLEAASAIAERDAEISRLQAELSAAKQPQTGGQTPKAK